MESRVRGTGSVVPIKYGLMGNQALGSDFTVDPSLSLLLRLNNEDVGSAAALTFLL